MNNLVFGPYDDKSAVVMLKKNDLYESFWQLVNRDKSHERSGRPDVNRDICHELNQKLSGRRSSNARQLCCVFHVMKPPKSISRKSSKHAEFNPKCEINESYCTSHSNSRPKSFARIHLPR